MADGSRHSLYAVKESTVNQIPGTPALSLVRSTGCTLGLAKESLESQELEENRQTRDFRLGADQVGGDVNFEMSFGTFDTLLESLFMNSWEIDTPSAGTDSIKVGTTRVPHTFVRYFSDIAPADKPYHFFSGCEINTLALTISANAKVTGVFTVLGMSQTLSTAQPAGATYPAPTVTKSMDSFTGTIQEGGSTIGVVTEVTLNATNNMAAKFVVGSKVTAVPSVGKFVLTGSITVFFENSTMLEKFINETSSSLNLSLQDTAGNVIDIIVPNIVYTGGKPDVTDPGPIPLNMPFQAIYDETSSTTFEMRRTSV